MSATNRGAKRSAQDFYPTPEWCVELLARRMDNYVAKKMIWGEPCAGSGTVINGMARIGVEPRQWIWAELSEGRDYLDVGMHGNYTEHDYRQAHDGIITNPPFSAAQEFLAYSLLTAPFVAYLLRLNFLGSQKRAEFWRKNAPGHLYVLSKRPSFSGRGTDATEYAWFVWDRIDLMVDEPGIHIL